MTSFRLDALDAVTCCRLVLSSVVKIKKTYQTNEIDLGTFQQGPIFLASNLFEAHPVKNIITSETFLLNERMATFSND